MALRFVEFHRLPIVVDERIRKGVERQVPRDCKRRRDLRRRYKRMCVRVAVIALREIAVKRRNDRVSAIRIIGVTSPLSDTRSACIGQHDTAHLFEHAQIPIAFDGIAH